MRRWLEIAIEIPAAASDALSHWLVERGAPGVIEETLADERQRIRAHFEEENAPPRLLEEAREFLGELEEFFPGAATSPAAIALIDAEDWAEGWKQGFPPLDVGRSLRIRPPWISPDDSARHDVAIEPAMAFGTGQHASTLGCLLAIEEIFETDPAIDSMLDVGTGSGILAIAAARLGARRVLAIDVDPIAIEAAAANVARNRLATAIELRCSSLATVSDRYRLIAANLYSGLLRSLFGGFTAVAEPDAWLVVAGLLDADREAVVESAATAGWRERACRPLDGWTTLTFRRED